MQTNKKLSNVIMNYFELKNLNMRWLPGLHSEPRCWSL